jgi:hypothetical protein
VGGGPRRPAGDGARQRHPAVQQPPGVPEVAAHPAVQLSGSGARVGGGQLVYSQLQPLDRGRADLAQLRQPGQVQCGDLLGRAVIGGRCGRSAVLAELARTWEPGGYHAFSADEGHWCAVSSGRGADRGHPGRPRPGHPGALAGVVRMTGQDRPSLHVVNGMFRRFWLRGRARSHARVPGREPCARCRSAAAHRVPRGCG